MIREIVRIDEDKCDGCGLCVPACAEGAIQIIDGKARLLADNLCDGLGACLGDCPRDAIQIERRDADEFDEEEVEKHLKASGEIAQNAQSGQVQGGCPSARVMNPAQKSSAADTEQQEETAGSRDSQLRQWPIQMHLVPPTAPFLENAELLLAADCAPFAYADFHKDLLQGKALLVGCPKLDDGNAYLEKMTDILSRNDIKSLTVAHMEVPCCSGLIFLAKQAIEKSGKNVPLETVRIGVQGDLK